MDNVLYWCLSSFGLIFIFRGKFISSPGGLADLNITSICDLLTHLYGPDFGAQKVLSLEEEPDRLVLFGASGCHWVLEHFPPERILSLQLVSPERAIVRARHCR